MSHTEIWIIIGTGTFVCTIGVFAVILRINHYAPRPQRVLVRQHHDIELQDVDIIRSTRDNVDLGSIPELPPHLPVINHQPIRWNNYIPERFSQWTDYSTPRYSNLYGNNLPRFSNITGNTLPEYRTITENIINCPLEFEISIPWDWLRIFFSILPIFIVILNDFRLIELICIIMSPIFYSSYLSDFFFNNITIKKRLYMYYPIILIPYLLLINYPLLN